MKKRKLLSILLSICMVVTWMPAGVWADTNEGGSIPNQTEQQSGDAEADLEGGDVDKTPDKGADSTGSYVDEETNLNKVGLFGDLYNTIEEKSTLRVQNLLAVQNTELGTDPADANNGESTHSNHPICGETGCT